MSDGTFRASSFAILSSMIDTIRVASELTEAFENGLMSEKIMMQRFYDFANIERMRGDARYSQAWGNTLAVRPEPQREPHEQDT